MPKPQGPNRLRPMPGSSLLTSTEAWPAPLQLAAIELTLRCNAKCIHCGSTAGRARRDELTLPELKRIFAELAGLGCGEVCLLGGEPFLCKWWHDAASEVVAHGMGLVLITNGAAVNAQVVSKLKRFGDRVRVGVSLDGASAKVHDGIRGRKGSFREARLALERLRGAGLECGAITTVMKQNIGELPSLRDMLAGKDLGWQIQIAGGSGGRFDRKWFLTVAEFYRVGEFLNECRRDFSLAELPVAGAHDIGYFSSRFGNYGVEPQENWRGCVAGLSVIGITSDGGVKGCLSLPDALREGNVRERSLFDIWRDGALFARNRRFGIGKLTGFCRKCEFASKCRGGCQEMCLSTTGSAWSNRFCFHLIETI